MDSHSFPLASSPLPFGVGREGIEGGIKQEIRLFGLGEYENTSGLLAFFSQRASVYGVLLHPAPEGKQWAQVWVRGEEEAEKCMEARTQLEASGVTMTRVPSHPSPPSTTLPPRFAALMAQSSPFSPSPASQLIPRLHSSLSFAPHFPTPMPGLERAMTVPLRQDISGLGYRHLDPSGPLPRNLYIVDLPLDMTEAQFRSLFERFGQVEHCKLLSQLDGMGRRRGFILMASHREALDAMRGMNGTAIEGSRMDVSWALVQREARHFGIGIGAMPNRVIHPPVHPPRRDLSVNSTVIAEGLDPEYFPSATTIRDLFSTFGMIKQCSILNTHPERGHTALIQYDSPLSANLLVESNGMVLGSKPITTRYLHAPQVQASYPVQDTHSSPYRQVTCDPFAQDFTHSSSTLKASSSPFIPSTVTVTTANDPRKTPSPITDEPRSSPSAGHSSDTRVSSLSASVSAGSKSDDDHLGYQGFGSIGVKTKGGGVGRSKMHDRWLSAGMRSGDDKWFKSTAWCKLSGSCSPAIEVLTADNHPGRNSVEHDSLHEDTSSKTETTLYSNTHYSPDYTLRPNQDLYYTTDDLPLMPWNNLVTPLIPPFLNETSPYASPLTLSTSSSAPA